MRILEADGISSVECPICHRDLRLITTTHLKSHGYTSKEDFLRDYPGTQLVSKEYEDRANEIRRNTLTNLNKSPEQRAKASERAKVRNSDSEFQKAMNRRRKWDKNERDKLSKSVKKAYADGRITYHPTYGKKIPYTTQDGRELILRSFLECRVCKFLELNNLGFEYESFSIPYEWNGSVHQYIPDFYLLDENLIVEVKPSDRQDSENALAKMKASKEQGYNFIFVSDSDLKDYETLLNKIIALRAK